MQPNVPTGSASVARRLIFAARLNRGPLHASWWNEVCRGWMRCDLETQGAFRMVGGRPWWCGSEFMTIYALLIFFEAQSSAQESGWLYRDQPELQRDRVGIGAEALGERFGIEEHFRQHMQAVSGARGFREGFAGIWEM